MRKVGLRPMKGTVMPATPGDEMRALPNHTIVNATLDARPNDTFRLMARDLPRTADDPNDRRFTNLDAGSEWFIRQDGTTPGGCTFTSWTLADA